MIPPWLAALLLLLLLAPAFAAADPFSVPGTVEQGEPTPIERASTWVLQTQRNLHRQLTLALHRLDETPTARTAGVLILASFLYGVFHAAGPGHGKAVISAYLLTHPQSLSRGIWLSTASSLLQGITAISAVLILTGVLGWLARDTMGQVRGLELASFLLVALLGLWLIARGLRSTWRLSRENRPNPSSLPDSAPNLAATSAAGVVFTRVGSSKEPGATSPLAPAPAMSMPNLHVHDADCGCATPHHVDPNQRGPWLATVVAVGIRPCSGAVLVMAVSLLLGIWAAGIAAVMAMSLGTAMTVSVLAILAVKARDWARRLLRPTRLSRLRYAGATMAILGGAVIFFIGWTLFQGTLTVAPMRHPLGL